MTTVERHEETVTVAKQKVAEETGSQVSINPKLKLWIEKIVADADDQGRLVPEDLHSRCQDFLANPPRCIPLSVVQRIADYASQRQEQGKTPKTRSAYVDEFLFGAKWFFAEGPAPPRRDRDGESAVERIRNDAAVREYERMTRNLSKKPADNIGSFAKDLKIANKEALAAFNCLLSVIGAFVFAYFATGLVVDNNVIAQVLVGIIVSTVVAIADIYFLLKKLHSDEVKASESVKSTGSSAKQVPSKKSKDV